MDVRSIGDTTYNRSPGFSQVCCFENVRFEIVKLMAIHCKVSCVPVVRRCLDGIDSAPLRHFRRDVRPMLAIVGSHLNESVVCAGPNGSLFHWRLGKRKHSVVIFDGSNVVR